MKRRCERSGARSVAERTRGRAARRARARRARLARPARLARRARSARSAHLARRARRGHARAVGPRAESDILGYIHFPILLRSLRFFVFVISVCFAIFSKTNRNSFKIFILLIIELCKAFVYLSVLMEINIID